MIVPGDIVKLRATSGFDRSHTTSHVLWNYPWLEGNNATNAEKNGELDTGELALVIASFVTNRDVSEDAEQPTTCFVVAATGNAGWIDSSIMLEKL